jgi:hypothetical protein
VSARRERSKRYAMIAVLALGFCASCSESYSFITNGDRVSDGGDSRTSLAFALNHRPVKLELYLNVEGGKALVELDHPDGRTMDALEFEGAGIREIRKEFDKEPGSWGLRVVARGGTVRYWAALHDRKKYIGLDDEARRLVGSRP